MHLSAKDRHGQNPGNISNLSVQRQLTNHDCSTQITLAQLPGSRQNTQGDRQIQGRTVFSQVRRCQVDCDPATGELKSRIANRRLDPFFGLPHCRIRETHDFKGGNSISDINLNINQRSIQAEDSSTKNFCEHRLLLTPRKHWECDELTELRPLHRSRSHRTGRHDPSDDTAANTAKRSG